MLDLNKLYLMDCMEGMEQLPDDSINCCVTSPPYYGLRDYSNETMKFEPIQYLILGFTVNIPEWEGQLGLEPTPEMYVGHIIQIFREVKRVLKKDGTLWLNLGDSYASTGKSRTEEQAIKNSTLQGSIAGQSHILKQPNKVTGDLKPKDLIGIPWMVAFALRSDGWYLRSDIIWSKSNPMPESVTDRPTKSHEYIFLMSKSKKYYYDADAIKTEAKYTNGPNAPDKIKSPYGQGYSRPTGWDTESGSHGTIHRKGRINKQRGHSRKHAGFNERWDRMTKEEQSACNANKRSVWNIATRPFPGAHFAVFPQELIIDCIKAGCPENGIVLDPFAGTNTTGIVARKLNRNYISIELNPKYKLIADQREYKELGIFK